MVYNYLDLYTLFVSEVSGGTLIFFALTSLIIGWICAKFRIPNMIILMLITIWSLMLSFYPGFTWLLPIVIIFAFAFIGWNLYKIFSR
jgi:biotin transporter BioY